jgi:hypothetical protein
VKLLARSLNKNIYANIHLLRRKLRTYFHFDMRIKTLVVYRADVGRLAAQTVN